MPLLDKQIPEQAREPGLTKEEVIRKMSCSEAPSTGFLPPWKISPKQHCFLRLSLPPLTGQSFVVSHGWFMQQSETRKFG
jgi:hypothetical protein